MRPDFVIFSFNEPYPPLHSVVFEGDAMLEVWSDSHTSLVKEPEGVVLNSHWVAFQAEKTARETAPTMEDVIHSSSLGSRSENEPHKMPHPMHYYYSKPPIKWEIS